VKIGIISDTHGDLTAWQKIWELDLSTCDLILHGGDVLYHGPRNPIKSEYKPAELAAQLNNCKVPIIIAQGNCDAYVDQMVLKAPIQSSPLFTQVEGLRFLVHHGHDIDEKGIDELMDKFRARIFVTGHTHVPILKRVDRYLYVNPGSCSLPKNQPKIPTYCVLDNGSVYLKDLGGQIIDKIEI